MNTYKLFYESMNLLEQVDSTQSYSYIRVIFALEKIHKRVVRRYAKCINHYTSSSKKPSNNDKYVLFFEAVQLYASLQAEKTFYEIEEKETTKLENIYNKSKSRIKRRGELCKVKQ